MVVDQIRNKLVLEKKFIAWRKIAMMKYSINSKFKKDTELNIIWLERGSFRAPNRGVFYFYKNY